MGISEDNTRYPLTISKELKGKLEVIAVEDGRTLNNMIIKILNTYVKEIEKSK